MTTNLARVPAIPVVYEEVVVGATAVGFAALPTTGQLVRTTVQTDSGPINFRLDGVAPTASVGAAAFNGDKLEFDRNEATRFLAIRQGVTNGVLRVHHYVRA